MPLPRFDFESHDWPPLAVGEREGIADAVFRVVWNGKLVEVMARAVSTPYLPNEQRQRLFFKRPEEKYARIVSLFPERQHHWPRLFSESFEEDIATLVQRAIFSGMWGYALRLNTIPLGVPATSWLYLDADGQTGCWVAFNEIFRPTHFRVEPNWFHLTTALADEHSDARFALSWSQLSKEEQQHLSLRFSNGNAGELRAIIRSLSLVNQPSDIAELIFEPFGFHVRHRRTLRNKPDVRLRRWALYINRYFAPFADKELMSQHQCVRFIFPRVRVELSASPPTQHERLEAALFPREWAKDKIPPDELRLLLPKL